MKSERKEQSDPDNNQLRMKSERKEQSDPVSNQLSERPGLE